MKIIYIKGKNKTAVLGALYEEYGPNFEIVSESHVTNNGFLRVFSKNEYSAKVLIKSSSSTQDMENSILLDGLGTDKNKVVPKTENTKDNTQLFLSLKQQIDGLQQAITHSSKDKKPSELTERLIKFLRKEQVFEEIIQEITSSLSTDPDIREVLSVIESFVRKYGKEPKRELDKVLIFVGSTGVGKTTTISKIAANLIMAQNKKVVLFTSDTYRIAAVDQLNTYADILNVPVEVIYPNDDIQEKINKWKHVDHILIDTAGRSHKNIEHVEDLKQLLDSIVSKEIFLVLNANMSCVDIKDVMNRYSEIVPSLEFIVTKTDETSAIGNLLNIMYHTNKPIQYITYGQSVPNDFSKFNLEKFINELVGKVEV